MIPTHVRDMLGIAAPNKHFDTVVGRLATALQSEIDVLLLRMQPVVIGAGVPMFADGVDLMRFDLVGSRTFDSGVMFLTYHRRADGGREAGGG